jgi:membrane associated rhomboid family serine protease
MVKNLLIANGVVLFLQLAYPGLVGLCALSNGAIIDGYFWQPFTYMWLHDGLMHIFFNMFALWMFGGQLEQIWGARRFLRFYLLCGLGAGFVILAWSLLMVGIWAPRSAWTYTLGASGAVYGILMAFSLTWPDRTIMLLFPPIPMKAIWFIPVLFVLQIGFGGGNISHSGHLGGVLIAGFLMRRELRQYLGSALGLRSLRYRWHRYRMRGRLRSVRREEWERRKRRDDDDRPTFH